jgi:hypothetical protein
MYDDLFRYLIRYNELPLPGVGTFSIDRQPAELDFPARRIYAPRYSIQFRHDSFLPGQHFFSWLAQVLNVSDREAIFRFNDFAFEMKKNLEVGNRIRWNGVGELSKDESGEINLIPAPVIQEESLPAEKVIREKAEHLVRVGEDERTSAEMTEFLGKDESRKLNWWVLALTIGILALMFTGWYLSENGLEIFSIMNNQKLVPAESPLTNYQVLQ